MIWILLLIQYNITMSIKHYHCINHNKTTVQLCPFSTSQLTKVDWELWFPRVPRTHLSQEGRYLEFFLLQVSGELLLQVSFGLLLQDTLFPQPTHLRTPTHGQLTHPRSTRTPMTLTVNPITYGYPHMVTSTFTVTTNWHIQLVFLHSPYYTHQLTPSPPYTTHHLLLSVNEHYGVLFHSLL